MTTSIDAFKVLVAKPGLDGHDRGAKVIATALRDAGMHVTYTGIRQSPEAIVAAAKAANADVVGLSILSGAHMELFPRIIEGLHERGMSDIVVIAGGIVPQADQEALREMGVAAVFGPGTRTADVVAFIRCAVSEQRDASTT